MESWWQGLSLLNKAFVASALFFSVLFAWQVIAMFLVGDGIGNHDSGHGGFATGDHASGHDGGHGTAEGATFTFVSLRSLVAFGTLFSWSGSLYLIDGTSVVLTLIYSTTWGLAAMLLVSYVVFRLLRLQEIPTRTLWTAVGEDASVYLNVPQDGVGKVRVKVGGIVSVVNARSANGEPLFSGTPVRVVGVVDENTLQVQPTDRSQGV